MFKIRNRIINFFMLFLTILLMFPYTYTLALDGETVYVWSVNDYAPASNVDINNAGIEGNNTGNFLGITSSSAILIDQKSGTVLYEHNIHEQLRPASVTKVMNTSLLPF